MMSWGKKKAPAHVERVWDLATGEGAQEQAILHAVEAANLDADEVAFGRRARGGKLVLVATAPDSFRRVGVARRGAPRVLRGTGLVKDLHLRGQGREGGPREDASWDFSGDASAVQRAIDDAKLDADEVSLTASGNVLVGVAPKGFDAWSWLDEEVQVLLLAWSNR